MHIMPSLICSVLAGTKQPHLACKDLSALTMPHLSHEHTTHLWWYDVRNKAKSILNIMHACVKLAHPNDKRKTRRRGNVCICCPCRERGCRLTMLNSESLQISQESDLSAPMCAADVPAPWLLCKDRASRHLI